jgi:hypothetical protein
LLSDLKKKNIEKIIVKRNCTFAFSTKDKIFSWGQMPKGLNFKPRNEIIDIPTKNNILQGFNFNSIALSQDSVTAIARSVMLNFEIAENDDSDNESINKK